MEDKSINVNNFDFESDEFKDFMKVFNEAYQKINDKTMDELQPLNEEEVWNAMEFLNFAGGRGFLGNIGGYFNPELVNNAMVRISQNPIQPTQEDIDNAYKTVFSSSKPLLNYSDFFELTSMLYKRIIEYFSSILSFDLEWECKTVGVDHKNQQYLADERRLQEFLSYFDYRYEFKRVLKQIIRHDTYYAALRKDDFNQKYSLQELPNEFCRIDGRMGYGLNYSFDMEWFYQTGVDIRMYPKYLQDAFLNMHDVVEDQYDPSKKILKRNGQWIEWVQVSPANGFWAFKFDEEQIAEVPLFSPMFREIAYKPIAEELQNNEFLIKTSQIVMAVMDTLNANSKGGAKQDNFSLSMNMAAAFSTLARNELGSLAKFVATPFKDNKVVSSELSNKNVLDDYQKITAAGVGGASRVYYSTDKVGEVEAKHNINVDELMIGQAYQMFANFIEYMVNLQTTKYKFKIKFVGTNLSANKKARIENARADMATGFPDIQLQASSRGLNSFEYLERLKYTKSLNLLQYHQPFATSNTTSGDTIKKNGRPLKENSGSGSGLDNV